MSNARNLANLLSPGVSTLATAAIADDAITSAKLDTNIAVDGSITAGTELIGNVSGRILLDASAAGTDVGDEFLLNATDGSASNDGGKILFEEGTEDPNFLLQSTSTKFGGTLAFENSPTGAGSRVLLLNTSINSPISRFEIDESYINGTYDEYELRCMFILDTDSVILEYDFLTTTSATGAGAAIGGNIYGYSIDYQDAAGERTTNAADHMEAAYNPLGSAAGEGCTIIMKLINVNETRLAPCSIGSANYNDVNAYPQGSTFSGGMTPSTYVAHYLRGIRFFGASGLIEAGSVKLFGVR